LDQLRLTLYEFYERDSHYNSNFTTQNITS
jgi:hypothetical protein